MILAGATAIVTGGAIRIGRKIGSELAQRGVNVCVHYGSSAKQAAEAVAEFRGYGVKAISVQADLNQPVEAAKQILEQATAELGPVSVLINSAAIFEQRTLLSTTEDNWDRHFAINLKAPFFLTQQFVLKLPPEMRGSVVNIVDWRGERPIPGQAAYTQAKAGFVAQTKLLAQELGPRIRVNGICPGAILPAPGETQEAFDKLAERNPLRQTGSPAAIAHGVIYLLEADFVTGEILHITGGEEL